MSSTLTVPGSGDKHVNRVLLKAVTFEVAPVQDSTLDTGHVTILVGRSGSISAEARFDNLVVREALVEP